MKNGQAHDKPHHVRRGLLSVRSSLPGKHTRTVNFLPGTAAVEIPLSNFFKTKSSLFSLCLF
jgi:hypothetical protein